MSTMVETGVASVPPISMGSELEFVMRECHCDKNRAKTLLRMNNNDPLKAARHQQKLSAMLAHKGHSCSKPRLLTPVSSSDHGLTSSMSGVPDDVPEHEMSDLRVPSSASDSGRNYYDTPTTNPPTSTAASAAAPTIIGLAEPRLDQITDAKTSQGWDFQLPQLPEEEASCLLITVGNSSAASQSVADEEITEFNLRELCAAVQQGTDLPTIQKHLRGFPDVVVKARINGTVEGIPAIFYAVKANDPALLRLWAGYGANVSAVHPTSGTPLLAYAIVLSEVLGGCDTSAVVATLLSLGASSTSVPDMFYKQYNRNLREDELVRDGSSITQEEWQWCKSPDVCKKLARTTNLTQRYYLDRATQLRSASTRQRQIAALRNAEAVLGLPYHLIGQTVAARGLLRKLMTHMTVPSKRPLVLVFAGPSGHGKTELARKLDDLLGLGLQVVDCTIFNEERELFGPRAPYVGSERGSPLNNFLARHTGQRSLVFLDEFEKTSSKIHQSLLLPFDHGTYQDRRNLVAVDCSHTIWVLATNALDETILQFCSAHPAILAQNADHAASADAQRLAKTLSAELRAAFLDRFGAPVTGRVSDFIPFLPFSPGEQAVVTHKFLRELVARVAAPVRLHPGRFGDQQQQQQQQLLGNVKLSVRHDASVCAQLAEAAYSEELGARSLRKAVEDVVQDQLVECYLDEEGEIEEGEGIQQTEFVVDVRADDVVVRKGAQ